MRIRLVIGIKYVTPNIFGFFSNIHKFIIKIWQNDNDLLNIEILGERPESISPSRVGGGWQTSSVRKIF